MRSPGNVLGANAKGFIAARRCAGGTSSSMVMNVSSVPADTPPLSANADIECASAPPAPGAAALSAPFAMCTVRSDGTQSCPAAGIRTAPDACASAWHLCEVTSGEAARGGAGDALVDDPLDERRLAREIDVVHALLGARPAMSSQRRIQHQSDESTYFATSLPHFQNGPTALMTTRAEPTALATLLASSTSTCTAGTRSALSPRSAATSASRFGARPAMENVKRPAAKSGWAPRCRAISRPVKPASSSAVTATAHMRRAHRLRR
jgi:hypothetical protein